MVTLRYYYDPLCGWCYGAAPLLCAVARLDGLQLRLGAGGLMSGEKRQQVTPALRSHVMSHDQRIATVTGQAFGTAYFDGLLRDGQVVLDSTPPTQAILAVAALGACPLAMLHQLQKAHYQEGLRITETSVLMAAAVIVGVDGDAFLAEFERQQMPVEVHIRNSRKEMADFGLNGFPALLLEQGSVPMRLDLAPYLGRPDAFVEYLSTLLARSGEKWEFLRA